MNRRIISEFGRMAPKCSLICGKVREDLPKQGDALRVRAPAAARDLRKNHEKAAERKEHRKPERGVEAHNSPDSGKHPMRKTITAVARDAAIWREHKRRQRPGEHDAMVAERKRGVSPSCAENHCRGEKICSYQKNEAPNRTAARNRQFPIQETTWPQGFPPWGQEGAPQQKEARLCRESRATRASRRRWGRASR